MGRMTGAQALVRSLLREGVEVVFGLPGVQIMDAFDALHDKGPGTWRTPSGARCRAKARW